MPRQTRRAWLSRASGSRRARARISDIACSATARAFTPAALASRMPRAASAALSNWSVPEPIDWMNRSLRRQRDQPVVPQAGHDDHIGLGGAAFERVAFAHLEARDAGVQRVEARLHLIRGMRKADDELVLGRDHAV